MRRFLIDTDTASDDAVAILMALRDPEVQVDALTIVSGNVATGIGAKNAGYTAELCGKSVPVFVGCNRPLLREASYAYFFHGSDGMGEMNYPAPKRAAEEEHAVEAMIRLVRARPGEYTLITLGPLTNLAMAVRLAPDIVTKFRQVYMLGGASCTVGNITPAAEYNIWLDPEAAKIVFHCGLPLTMIGVENCRGAAELSDAEMAHIRNLQTPYAGFAFDCNRTAFKMAREWLHHTGFSLADPTAMAVALDASICTKLGHHFVEIETASEVTRGMTVVDQNGVLKQQPNVEVVWSIDPAKWKELLYARLS